MKLSRQAEVKEEALIKAHDPEAFLTQIADTLQASLLRSGQVRAELFGGQSFAVTGRTTRITSATDLTTVIEVTLDIQKIAEAVADLIYEYEDSLDVGKTWGHNDLRDWIFDRLDIQANHQAIERSIAWLRTLDNPPSSG